jgi:hypothetical protein
MEVSVGPCTFTSELGWGLRDNLDVSVIDARKEKRDLASAMNHGVAHLERPPESLGQPPVEDVGGGRESLAGGTTFRMARGSTPHAVEIVHVRENWATGDPEHQDHHGRHAIERRSDCPEHRYLRHLSSEVTFEVLDPAILLRHTVAATREIVIIGERERKLNEVGADTVNRGYELIGNDGSLFDVFDIGELLVPPDVRVKV